MSLVFLPIVLFVFFVLAYFIFYGRLVSPASLVLSWWIFWYVVLLGSDIGFPSSSRHLHLVLTVFFLFFALGSLWPPIICFTNVSELGLYSFNKKILYFVGFLGLPLLLFFYRKAQLVLSGDSFSGSRAVLIDYTQGSHPVFGSGFVRNSVDLLFAGPLFYLSLFAIPYLFTKQNVGFLAISSLGIFLYQATEFGRSQIYRQAIIFMIGIYLFKRHFKVHLRLRYWLLFAGVLLLVVAYMYYSAITRLKNDPSASASDVVTEFISYHTVGYVLLDQALSDQTSPLNDLIGWGRASLAGFLLAFTQIIRLFNSSYQPFLMEWLPYTEAFHDLGIKTASGKPFMFNAYYTMLFPFYLDFRLPGVAIISFSIGLGLHSFYESWLRYKSPLAFAWFVFLASFCMMSIFLSLTQKVYFFSALFLLLTAYARTNVRV